MSLILKPEDLEERFIRSRGKGGQNVNKVATCVQLRHIPTGTSVKCDIYRTQRKNRETAMAMLIEKIEKKEQLRLRKLEHEVEKEKRRKRRKPKALREEIMRLKKINSEKKQLRKMPQ